MKTEVIFRQFPEGDIIALFPFEFCDLEKKYISSYMHIGQHSAASPDLIWELSRVQEDQYKPLEDELRAIGYNLKIIEI